MFEKKHIPLVVLGAGALAGVAGMCLCCGVSAWIFPSSRPHQAEKPAKPGVKGTPLRADEVDLIFEQGRDADSELEVLPRLRTGMTREQAKAMLTVGTLKEWKLMTPEGHIAVCRLAARRLHPTGDEEVIAQRARNYVKMLDEMVYSGQHNEQEQIGSMIALEDALYQAMETEDRNAEKRNP